MCNIKILIMEKYEYDLMINPRNLFESNEELEGFIDLNPMELGREDRIEALRSFLGECEREEAYEFCRVITNKIKELK